MEANADQQYEDLPPPPAGLAPADIRERIEQDIQIQRKIVADTELRTAKLRYQTALAEYLAAVTQLRGMPDEWLKTFEKNTQEMLSWQTPD